VGAAELSFVITASFRVIILLVAGGGEAGKRVVRKREGESRGSVRGSLGEAGGRVEGKREGESRRSVRESLWEAGGKVVGKREVEWRGKRDGGEVGGRVVVEWRGSEGEQIFHCAECSRKKNISHFQEILRSRKNVIIRAKLTLENYANDLALENYTNDLDSHNTCPQNTRDRE